MSDARPVHLHPHARARLSERGATEFEVIQTVQQGERFLAKHGRTGFRRNFPYHSAWFGEAYANKQIEAFAVYEHDAWLVISFLVKYF